MEGDKPIDFGKRRQDKLNREARAKAGLYVDSDGNVGHHSENQRELTEAEAYALAEEIVREYADENKFLGAAIGKRGFERDPAGILVDPPSFDDLVREVWASLARQRENVRPYTTEELRRILERHSKAKDFYDPPLILAVAEAYLSKFPTPKSSDT